MNKQSNIWLEKHREEVPEEEENKNEQLRESCRTINLKYPPHLINRLIVVKETLLEILLNDCIILYIALNDFNLFSSYKY